MAAKGSKTSARPRTAPPRRSSVPFAFTAMLMLSSVISVGVLAVVLTQAPVVDTILVLFGWKEPPPAPVADMESFDIKLPQGPARGKKIRIDGKSKKSIAKVNAPEVEEQHQKVKEPEEWKGYQEQEQEIDPQFVASLHEFEDFTAKTRAAALAAAETTISQAASAVLSSTESAASPADAFCSQCEDDKTPLQSFS